MVAAVNGPAVGIGASLALACDLVLAAESAYFGLAFVNIGLMPDGGSTLFVPAAVGKARAFQMALLGERIDSARALDWGLVNYVHPDDRAAARGQRAGRAPGRGPTRSYAGSKRALNRMLYPDLDGQLDLEAEIQHALARTKDFQEGVTAFVEKREAAFQGRLAPARAERQARQLHLGNLHLRHRHAGNAWRRAGSPGDLDRGYPELGHLDLGQIGEASARSRPAPESPPPPPNRRRCHRSRRRSGATAAAGAAPVATVAARTSAVAPPGVLGSSSPSELRPARPPPAAGPSPGRRNRRPRPRAARQCARHPLQLRCRAPRLRSSLDRTETISAASPTVASARGDLAGDGRQQRARHQEGRAERRRTAAERGDAHALGRTRQPARQPRRRLGQGRPTRRPRRPV